MASDSFHNNKMYLSINILDLHMNTCLKKSNERSTYANIGRLKKSVLSGLTLFCNLFPLHCKECKVSQEGYKYQGSQAETRTGLTCQRWDTQEPHKHTNNDAQYFPDQSLEDAANFCRNPDREPGGPWCYTTDDDTRWEYCDIPWCGE